MRALPQTCTQESFRSYWRQFGPITDATLMMDKETGRHRGFGFVNYETREAVEKVLQSGPHYMDGQMVRLPFVHLERLHVVLCLLTTVSAFYLDRSSRSSAPRPRASRVATSTKTPTSRTCRNRT